jgi:CheY-like chemotaxis protein/anti-sigma regulatory factor (Ser/Thr protein kinase)
MGEGHPFDLQKLVSEAVELTKPLWKPPSNASKYHLNVIGQQRCFVKGKSSEIYEVLVNLIRNALESMPSGGSLTISAVPKNGHVYLGISDTGCGILDEHLQRIFEPFFTTKSSQNSGLGLSSCYGIVKKHGGEIHVYTTPGAGTEFMVILPQADAPQPIKQKEFASLENAPIRFLIIDDEINILKFMEMYFEDTEIDIATACSAREGLQAIRENPFDVVLCDLGMDEMNGLELGQELSDYCRTKGIPKIPFLLYTGLNKQFDTDTLAKAGIDKVVNKPTPCDELLKIVQDVVAQRNAHRLVGG